MFRVIEVALERIQANPYQQRTLINPEYVERLAVSIQSEGLQQPPQARESPNLPGKYELVFGHNRFAAYQLLSRLHPDDPKYAKMPILLVSLDERKMFEGGITENLQRQDISPIAKARALKTYIEIFKATQRECGMLFGMSQGAVSNLIRLLSLPDEVTSMTDRGQLAERGTRLLVGLPKPIAIKIAQAALKLDENSRTAYIERCVYQAKVDQKGGRRSDRSGGTVDTIEQFCLRQTDDLLLAPESCPRCYRTPKSYVRDGKKWRCGHCQANVQLNVLSLSAAGGGV